MKQSAVFMRVDKKYGDFENLYNHLQRILLFAPFITEYVFRTFRAGNPPFRNFTQLSFIWYLYSTLTIEFP